MSMASCILYMTCYMCNIRMSWSVVIQEGHIGIYISVQDSDDIVNWKLSFTSSIMVMFLWTWHPVFLHSLIKVKFLHIESYSAEGLVCWTFTLVCIVTSTVCLSSSHTAHYYSRSWFSCDTQHDMCQAPSLVTPGPCFITGFPILEAGTICPGWGMLWLHHTTWYHCCSQRNQHCLLCILYTDDGPDKKATSQKGLRERS